MQLGVSFQEERKWIDLTARIGRYSDRTHWLYQRTKRSWKYQVWMGATLAQLPKPCFMVDGRRTQVAGNVGGAYGWLAGESAGLSRSG